MPKRNIVRGDEDHPDHEWEPEDAVLYSPPLDPEAVQRLARQTREGPKGPEGSLARLGWDLARNLLASNTKRHLDYVAAVQARLQGDIETTEALRQRSRDNGAKNVRNHQSLREAIRDKALELMKEDGITSPIPDGKKKGIVMRLEEGGYARTTVYRAIKDF